MAMNLKLNAPGMSVDELESMLPALGVVLPSGSKLNGGTLSADLALSGSIDNLVIAGPVRMSNVKLAGFDMGSKLGALSAFSGKAPSNPDTTIQNASLNANVSPGGTRADAINVTIPSLGVLTGAGTISPNGALDFNMMADLQTNRSEARAERTGRGAERRGLLQDSRNNSKPDLYSGRRKSRGQRCQRGNSEILITGNKTSVGGLLGKRKPN